MELFTQLLNALWAQDYETLANPSMIGMLYFVLFMILFLENGLLPAAFLPGDSLLAGGTVEEKIQKPGLMRVMKRPSLRQSSWLLGGSLLLGALFWLWLAVQQQEATLAIRPVGQGIGMPDGFSVWHHLDANGIRFKSITPQKDGLLIKFDSTAQGAAAKEVLGRALPHGYIIALLEDDNSPTAWLSRLRDAPHRLG